MPTYSSKSLAYFLNSNVIRPAIIPSAAAKIECAAEVFHGSLLGF